MIVVPADPARVFKAPAPLFSNDTRGGNKRRPIRQSYVGSAVDVPIKRLLPR